MKKRSPDWPGAALRAAALFPRERLQAQVVAFADARRGREAWAVALSGGADSVALLLLLWAHWPKCRERLVALHFNHRLRGAESNADARFCKSLCRSLGVRFAAGSWKAPRGVPAEAVARDARFAFFEKAMARMRARVLWLGHQQDDIAESLLMRLSRGSGSAGLAAPRAVHAIRTGSRRTGSRIHVRPLLTLKKAEIARALRSLGVTWREDSSNRKGVHFRNRIRQEVIPRWVLVSQRDALSGAARSRELLDEDDRALEAWVDLLSPMGKGRELDVAGLAGKPRAVVRRALHRWLARQPKAAVPSRQAFDILLLGVERGRPFRHSLGTGGFAVIRGGILRFEGMRKSRASD